MRISNTVYFFPWWGLLLLATLPAALAAVAAFPLRRFIPGSDEVVDARNRLLVLGTSAYIFTLAFSVNTLWNQDTKLVTSALSFDDSVSSLKEAARDHADVLPADIDEKIEALRQPDVIVEAVSELPNRDLAFYRAFDDLTGAWADVPAAVGNDLELHAEDTQRDFFEFAASSNTPGVPGIMLVVIMLLGMVLAGAMAAAPLSAGLSRTEATAVDWLMIAGVVIVGLVQWPLWILDSRDFVLSIILQYFSSEMKFVTGFHWAVGAVILVVPLLGAAVLLRTRHRRHRQSQPDADQPRSSNGVGALENRVTDSQADPETPPTARDTAPTSDDEYHPLPATPMAQQTGMHL